MDVPSIAARNIYRKWEWTAAFTYYDLHNQAMAFAWQRQGTWRSDSHGIRDLHYQLSNWVRKELRAQGWKADRGGKNWRRQERPVAIDSGRYDYHAADAEYLRLAVEWPEMTRQQWNVFADFILTGHPIVAAEFEVLEASGQRSAWKEKQRAALRVKHAAVLAEAQWHATYGPEGIQDLMTA